MTQKAPRMAAGAYMADAWTWLAGAPTRLRQARRDGLLPQARLAGPMPWVLAIMVFLMTISASGALALHSMLKNANAELTGGLTVQIVEADGAQRAGQVEETVAMLRQLPAIADVRPVPPEELSALLAPWLGEELSETGMSAVPVPALIDVRLQGEAGPQQVAALQAELAQIGPGVRVDAQSAWLEPVFSALQSLQWLALALISLLAIATSAAVWLAARNALGANRETIEIVHHLGGTDRQIAATFQRSVAVDAVMGGLAGFLLGLIAAYILGSRFAALESGLVAGGGLGLRDWMLATLVPAGGVVLAIVTMRVTVLSALRRML